MYAEWVVAGWRVLFDERVDIDLTRGIVASHLGFFDAGPVVGGLDGAACVVGDGVVPVVGDFRQQAVGILDDAGGFALLDDFFFEAGVEPDAA